MATRRTTDRDVSGVVNILIILQGDTRRSSLDEVTDWVLWADKTITF